MRKNHVAHCTLETLESRQLLSAPVTIMSQNLYLGADLTPVIVAASTDPASVPAAVSAVWQTQLQTNFATRADKIADEIADTRPDFIGLQEAERWTLVPPSGPQDAQVIDYISILSADLNQRGLHYAQAIVTSNLDVWLPDAGGNLINLTDRNAILVNLDAPGLKITSTSDGHFATQVPLAFNENASWQAVDVTLGKQAFRYVNTHLTSVYAPVQQAQAAELLAGPGATNLPVILGGDYNSDACHGAFGGPDATATYDQLVASGLTDAWLATGRRGPGFTWGQSELLDNKTSTANERIDLFLTRGAIRAVDMDLEGTRPIRSQLKAGTPPYWASDHFGIVATFKLAQSHQNGSHGEGHAGCSTAFSPTARNVTPVETPAARLKSLVLESVKKAFAW